MRTLARTVEDELPHLIQLKCKALQAGIEYRRRMSKVAPSEEARAEWNRQVENWEQELRDIKGGALHDHINLVEKPLLSNRESKRVDIIVLKYKLPEAEVKCMECLIRNTDWPHRVTWYDSRDQTANFSKLWNRLVRESTCEFILIMDSDAYVPEGWLSKMMECFEPGYRCRKAVDSEELVRAAPVGVVAPATNQGGASTIQGYDWGGKTPFLTDEQMSGFFFLFRKAVVEDIGYFDERFYLHGQDSEWMDRVIESDWNVVIRTDVLVRHDVSASIKKATEDGEFNYKMDIQYTRMIYDIIRDEKRRRVYESPRY